MGDQRLIEEAHILWADTKSVSAGQIEFDAVLSERHNLSARATKHPVEQGTSVSDHIHVDLPNLELHVLFTNTPITELDIFGKPLMQSRTASLDVPKYDPPLSPTPGALYSALGHAIKSLFSKDGGYKAKVLQARTPGRQLLVEAQSALWTLIENRVPLTVVTNTYFYEDMYLVEAPGLREAGKGLNISFTLKFERIRTVSSSITSVPRDPKAKPPVNKGKQNPKIAPGDKSGIAASWQGSGVAIPVDPGGP